MGLSINQIKAGIGILMDGNVFIVVESQHIKPGKGGAFAKVKIKNVRTQQTLEKTIKSADKLEEIHLEERKLQNLYESGENYHFMDNSTFEEVVVSKSLLGDSVSFLQENAEVTGMFYNNELLKIELPIFIITEVTHTEPGFKGDTSKSGNKPAVIDTGATIQVPLFLDIGDKIKIDTRTGTYVERVKA